MDKLSGCPIQIGIWSNLCIMPPYYLSKSVQKKEENIAIIGNLDFDVKQCLRVYE